MNQTESLKQTGLVNVQYPSSARVAVKKAVTSWKIFCGLPVEVKKSFIYEEGAILDGAGYELKEEKGSRRDLKENFHVTLAALSRLEEAGRSVSDPNARIFIDDAHNLVKFITPLIMDFAEKLERNFKLPRLADEVLRGREHWILRYLHYFGDRSVGEEIATAHADKSGFTLHLYESAPGLQFLEITGSGMWKEMPVSEGQTVIIPNMQLQYRTCGELKALCHRVVATEDTAKTGRYSVVCFIPFTSSPAYNKGGMGRLQEFSPGFNYTMAHGDFSQLFV
ncbi:MAG: 2OG-Fe(II) oxygenase family protein [Patescibacteria group bacterium]